MKFFEELKRRNVIKATMAYVVVAWVYDDYRKSL